MMLFDVLLHNIAPTLFQSNGQCNSFNSIEQLKSRPAHLAAFLHHVFSQFDPAPVVRPQFLLHSWTSCVTCKHGRGLMMYLKSYFQLCYLYADFYKQTNSKETRRVFMDLHNFFIDRGAVSAVCWTVCVLNQKESELLEQRVTVFLNMCWHRI